MSQAHPPPRPLAETKTPKGLSGISGTNRAGNKGNQLGVRTDRKAIEAWLKVYEGEGLDGKMSPTWVNYRKESERFLLWAWMVRGKALSSLDTVDMQAYRDFFIKQPLKRWVGPPRHRSDRRWRPFAPITSKERGEDLYAQTERILRSLFGYLCVKGYLRGNPLELPPKGSGKKRGKSRNKGPARHLGRRAWGIALRAQERALASASTDVERAKLRRERWVVTWLYYTGARRAEAAAANASQILIHEDDHGKQTHWWDVTGKGRTEGQVPLVKEVIEEMEAYRSSLGLPALPVGDEKTPLICQLPAKNTKKKFEPRRISPEVVGNVVKVFFGRAAEAAKKEGNDLAAGQLAAASAHWIRHTTITHQIAAGVPLEHVRDNARHSSITTTSGYIHTEDLARAKSIRLLGKGD